MGGGMRGDYCAKNCVDRAIKKLDGLGVTYVVKTRFEVSPKV